MRISIKKPLFSNRYSRILSGILSMFMIMTIFPIKTSQVKAAPEILAEQNGNTIHLKNDYFDVEVGKYGQITSLKIVGDKFDTNYVMNESNSPGQKSSLGHHQWMGELMFKTKLGDAEEWTTAMTNSSDSVRRVELDGKKIRVTYHKAKEKNGIKDFKLVETYSLVDDKLNWEIKITNTSDKKLTVGDFGVPLAFNEMWTGNDQIYETRTVDHSFVGKNSSYVYATRPSGLGQFLLLTPDPKTGAGFEYQDHWRKEERSKDEVNWCQDQAGWQNGLNVFYIHSEVIKSTNRGYLENTSLELAPEESKTYSFNFTAVENEKDMKKTLYDEGLIDAVAVPGMTFSVDMPAKMYLHTKVSKEDINFEVQCPHETGLHEGNPKTISNNLPHDNDKKAAVDYIETKIIDGEQYHVYNISFPELGQNNVIVKYEGGQKETVLQFYMMDSAAAALELHSNFMVDKTQWNEPGKLYDKVFDDWMMDTKSKRGEFKGYWGWGDDWGLTHGEFLAEKNVYQPNAREITALDEYLDVAIWNGLMREHQEDYLIHDFLMQEPNDTPTYRGYAYPHIYNTYFSMYKIATKYPELATYKENADTYLLRTYNILKALYGEGVAYNWETGVMGELTTPDIIAALDKEGYYEEAQNIRNIMSKKYDNFKNTKYPYGSEYSYDNTGEEAVYTLAKLNNATDKDNSNSIMSKIDTKTRATRGLQPIWYHYASPVTNCGENWWNFQYTVSLAGYAMDDWLRLQDNGKTANESALSERLNYAAKLANLTAINSGQIDADKENLGTVAWTYQAEMGNLGGQGTGGGKLHNGWRQMAGEADLGLFGALQILSADVAVDPVFGLFGYGCKVKEEDNSYEVIPLDGLFTRLNFINEKLYIKLTRDQYTKAVVNKERSAITLNIKNLAKTEHQTDIEIIGLKVGSYRILVDGKLTGSFQAFDNRTTMVSVPLPAAEGAIVTIEAGAALENTAPLVEAGTDKEVYVSDVFRLEGQTSDDGYPSMSLSNKWSIVSSPEGAKVNFGNDDRLITTVTVDKAGEYKFKLTVNDGTLENSDTIVVKVLEDLPVPKNLAIYSFDKIDLANKLVLDESGTENNALIVGTPLFAQGKEGNGVSMNGNIGGYVKLPASVTRRVKEFTIAADVKINSLQSSETRLFEFGDMNNNYFYVSFVNGNEISFTMTNMPTHSNKTMNTGVAISSGYWKNIEVTLQNNIATLYVDGIEKSKITDCGFTLDGLGEIQRNFIGRSYDEKVSFLNGSVDNFEMKSVAMTAEELRDVYGFTGERKPVSSTAGNIVTQVGKAPILPEKIKTLYSDGLYTDSIVTWQPVDATAYAQAGSFSVSGKVEGIAEPVKITVFVVSNEAKNLALIAKPSAIIDTPADLGGVKGLNDDYDPISSRDTSHGVWHNWQGDQGGKAWVQYDWDQKVILTGMDAYYFTDGNFAPATVEVQYRDDSGAWIPVSNAKGLGVDLNKYNHTSFDPIATTGLRMWMTPKTLGCGVIEWKAYGYTDKAVVNKKFLTAAITHASGLKEALFSANWSVLQAVLQEANAVRANAEATQETVDQITLKLNNAIAALVPLRKNIAFNALASTSYCSPWETLSAVNDNIVSETSLGAEVKHYGTWGNLSSEESVTYTWSSPMNITSTELFLFNDNGGIKTPKSYKYEYMNASGEWNEISNAQGYGLELNKYNVTTFNQITTTALRITLVKPVTDGEGIGIIEWKVIGEKVQQ